MEKSFDRSGKDDPHGYCACLTDRSDLCERPQVFCANGLTWSVHASRGFDLNDSQYTADEVASLAAAYLVFMCIH